VAPVGVDLDGPLTAADLPTLYSQLMANAAFTTELGQDVTAVTNAAAGWRTARTAPPAARVRRHGALVAQISRTGDDQILLLLNGSRSMVGANLSSPEDDTASLRNYDLHMACSTSCTAL
jgi:hypothetical protein